MDIKSLIMKNHEKLKYLGEDKMKVVTQNWLHALDKIKK